MAPDQGAAIDANLRETLDRRVVLARVRTVVAGDGGEEEPMLSEGVAHYGLAQPFHDARWFETEHHWQVARTLAWGSKAGSLS